MQLARKDLIGLKIGGEIPYKIKHVLKKTNNSISDIDIFSTHGIVSLNKSTSNHEVINRKIKEVQSSRLSLKNKKSQINFLNERYAHEKRALKRNAKNILSLKKNSKKLRFMTIMRLMLLQHIFILDGINVIF